MKLYLFEKYDDFIWERALSVLRLGRYWVLQFAAYQSAGRWGLESSFCPSYPVVDSVAEVKIYLGNVGFQVSFLDRIYDFCSDCELCGTDLPGDYNG